MRRVAGAGKGERNPFQATLALCLALFSIITFPAHSTLRRNHRPSVLIILTDDQRWDTLWSMPTVQADLAAHGIEFTNGFASNPLCCPSRASILTGKYSHSTGVWTDQPPNGGWEAFDDRSTIATWLQAAGYHTALFGKYLNGYHRAPAGYIPPGWQRWVAFPISGYFDYELNVDGTIESFGTDPADYSTDVLAKQASRFIRTTQGPVFVYFAPYAPHSPSTPASQYAESFSDLTPWRPPSYNEDKIRDKPAYISVLPRWDGTRSELVDAYRQNQYRTLLSVDDAVGKLISALRATGRLHNTLIIFMSDNGLSWGEHRWSSKMVPYEESIRVPFAVRYDPLITSPRTDDHLVVNIDVAPTIADLAGVDAPGAEGHSLLPLLSSPVHVRWRHHFLIEHAAKVKGSIPSFCGVRTEAFTYVYYSTGEEELYDLANDPYELTNREGWSPFAAVQAALRPVYIILPVQQGAGPDLARADGIGLRNRMAPAGVGDFQGHATTNSSLFGADRRSHGELHVVPAGSTLRRCFRSAIDGHVLISRHSVSRFGSATHQLLAGTYSARFCGSVGKAVRRRSRVGWLLCQVRQKRRNLQRIGGTAAKAGLEGQGAMGSGPGAARARDAVGSERPNG